MRARRVAWLYPSTGLLDGHVHALAATRGVEVFVFRVAADPDAELAVASLGEPQRLAHAAREARAVRPDVVAWACTAGSYLGGPDAERERRTVLAEAAGCPATTTTAAITWALAAHRARRVVVLTPYTTAVGTAFSDYLASSGIEVVAQAHAGHDTDERISAMSTANILALVPGGQPWGGADCVVLPCTGLRSEPAAPAVHARTGLPVVTANAATLDHGLSLLSGDMGQDSGVHADATNPGSP